MNHEGGFPLWASCYRSRHRSDTWNQRYVNRNLLPQYVKFLGSLTKPGLRTIKNSQSEVALTWLDDRTLRIRFADNSTDVISLKLANNIPGIVVPCLFSGSTLQKEKCRQVVHLSYSLGKLRLRNVHQLFRNLGLRPRGSSKRERLQGWFLPQEGNVFN